MVCMPSPVLPGCGAGGNPTSLLRISRRPATRSGRARRGTDNGAEQPLLEAEMSETAARREVPGRVVVVTDGPVTLPASVAGGQSSLAEQLQDRPWIVAAAMAALAVGLLVV